VGDGAGEIPLSVADLIAERTSVMPDKRPVMTSPVYPSVERDRDASLTSPVHPSCDVAGPLVGQKGP